MIMKVLIAFERKSSIICKAQAFQKSKQKMLFKMFYQNARVWFCHPAENASLDVSCNVYSPYIDKYHDKHYMEILRRDFYKENQLIVEDQTTTF